MYRIKDFPDRGANRVTLKVGTQPYYLARFITKNASEQKKLDHGCVPGASRIRQW